jgi:hypothetical protein
MLYSLLADAVLVLHLAFILFVAAGGVLVLRAPRLALVHLPFAAWGVWVELSGWACPLTDAENYLRERAGAGGYAGGFTEHYLLPVIYPVGLTRPVQFGLAAGLLAVNALVYVLLARRLRQTGISDVPPAEEP